MTKKFMLCFATVALMAASAATHRITFFQAAIVNGTELKPGDYKLETTDTKATVSNGKQRVEADVTTREEAAKNASTSVRYQNGDGKYRVQEIRIGGTNKTVVFN